MIGKVISVLLLVAAGLALHNVYGDNTEVLRRAEALACSGAPCVRLLRAQRTPLEQSFTFQTALNPATMREIRCTRAFVLAGDVGCAPAR